ncbi:hypothetical protein 2 [Beihai sobemo-like virus 26]|uniref:hypothetical protein 2 n=1 Tax=Beihai sobemo-like virus 26 TaxID=1922698 RepID=UPI00090C701D|nr:hypothetical protein 2 [Beihai sobemo-like virus 26]APG75672.1 hypothetical protein 2 [Beihai sobemo-like virus 26]
MGLAAAAKSRFRAPGVGGSVERKSLELHASLMSCDRPVPARSLQERAFNWALRELAPVCCELPPDFFERSHFDRVLNSLNMQASPGYPLMRVAPTVGSYLKRPDGSWRQDRVEQLWASVLQRVDSDPDLIRVFVKQEPHRIAKVREGRMRLIQAVSLVDQVVDHLLHDHLQQREIELFGKVPVMTGWAPVHGGWRHLHADWWGYDRSAWDWTVPAWLLRLEWRLREALTINPTRLWLSQMQKRYDELFVCPEFVLSDGMVVKQCIEGVMKTGSVVTASANSHMQLLLHAVAAFAAGEEPGPLIAMGDDTMQPLGSEAYLQELRKYVNVKEPELGEFCSRVIQGSRVEPQNILKHVANLITAPPEFLDDMLLSLQVEYARSRWLRLWQLTARRLGCRVRPQIWLLDVYDEA